MAQITIDTEDLRPLVAAALLEDAIESRFDRSCIERMPTEVKAIWLEEAERFQDRYGYAP